MRHSGMTGLKSLGGSMARDKSSGEIVIEKDFPEGAIVRAAKRIVANWQ